jgi:hypothetical protein
MITTLRGQLTQHRVALIGNHHAHSSLHTLHPGRTGSGGLRQRLAGTSEAEAEARLPKVSLNVLNVSFDAIRDPKERAYFMELPTSFVLPPEEVDRLRDMAGQLMRESEDYEKIVQSLGGGVTK